MRTASPRFAPGGAAHRGEVLETPACLLARGRTGQFTGARIESHLPRAEQQPTAANRMHVRPDGRRGVRRGHRLARGWQLVSSLRGSPRAEGTRRANRVASQPMPNRLANETSPYLLQHKDNPVEWYPWGEEALAARPRAGPAAARVDRLLGVPLVPRDGARIVRGPGDRRADERAFRSHQGRSRGAPRHRRDLHGGLPAHDRSGRLAAEHVPDAGGRPVLRRARTSRRSRATGCRAGGWCSRVSPTRGSIVARRSASRAIRSCRRCRPRPGSQPSPEPIQDEILDQAVAALRSSFDRAQRRLGGRAEVPAGIDDRVPARPRRA